MKGKKERKKKKKRKQKLAKIPPTVIREEAGQGNDSEETFLICAEDVIDMGLQLGAHFKGPRSELKEKIESILVAQKMNWANSQR